MIENYLIELIKGNNRVIIPDLGAFMISRSADKETIAFNDFLKFNDGLLINHIVKSEKIAKTDANEQVKQWVKQIEKSLKEENQFLMGTFGRFFKDEKGSVCFDTQIKKEEIKISEPDVVAIPEADKSDVKVKETGLKHVVNDDILQKAHEIALKKKQEGNEKPGKKRMSKSSGEPEDFSVQQDLTSVPSYEALIPPVVNPVSDPIVVESEPEPKEELITLAVKEEKSEIPVAEKKESESIPATEKEKPEILTSNVKEQTLYTKKYKPDNQKLTTEKPNSMDRTKKVIIILSVAIVVIAAGIYSLMYFEIGFFKKKKVEIVQQVVTPVVDSAAIKAEQAAALAEAERARIEAEANSLKDKYHMVAGSFKVQDNATRFSEKLKQEGYKSNILGPRNGYYIVTYATYGSLKESWNDLGKYREKQPEVWVLHY